MPSYKVVAPGFIHGRIYKPNGKRKVVHTDKPFPLKNKVEQVPSWLEAMEEETAAQRKARLTAETKATNAAKKKAADDAKDIAGASFLDDAPSDSGTVETL